MRILMVTPYPPMRDGVAAYALQSVAKLRAEGHDVEVLSPGPSAAHHHLALVGPRGALALAKRVRSYDKVIVQFHPDVFFPLPASAAQWAEESLALSVAFGLAREVEVRVHEIDYTRGKGAPLIRWANRLPWHAVTRVVVHTEIERQSFADAFGLPLDRIAVAAHGADFQRRTDLSRTEARAALGLPDDDVVFLNIGFIQPHKGFDRAVRALRDLGELAGSPAPRPYRLDIVGSVRTPEPHYLAHLDELRALVDATPGAFLHEGYVSPELFDRWLAASDVVVLPYRSIWSSSVLERALLYDCRVIATKVGGLGLQAGGREAVTLVDDDDGLRDAMGEAVGLFSDGHHGTNGTGPALLGSWRDLAALGLDEVQREVRRRAALRRRPVRNDWAATEAERRGGDPPSEPLRRVVPLVPAPPASKRPGGAALKRMAAKLVAWQVEPLISQVNTLHQAAIEALDGQLAAGGPERRIGPEPPAAGRPGDGEGAPADGIAAAGREAAGH